MKKGVLVISLLLLCVMFSGCAEGDVEAMATRIVEEMILQKTGIEENEYYIRSEELVEQGILTETGEIVEEEEKPEPIEERDGQIRVTFADNQRLDIKYYSDAEFVNLIDTDKCYLNPGDCIYAYETLYDYEYSKAYTFSEFRIYEYDEKGTRRKVIWPQSQNIMAIQIPENYKGKEISILPVGEYIERVLTLNDYVINTKGEKEEQTGSWKVNDNEYFGERVEISPVISYTVNYKYDNNLFYFVSSNPSAYYPKDKGNEEGEVIFKEESSSSDVNEYSVELHRYIKAVIDNSTDGVKEVKVKKNSHISEADKKIEVDKLKCGDVIEIITEDKYKLMSSQVEVTAPTKVTIDKKQYYSFSVIIPETAATEIDITLFKWQSKDVAIEVDKTNWVFANKNKESVVSLRSGSSSYSYEQLQKQQKITLNEMDELVVDVNKNLLEDNTIQLIVDDKEPIYINSSSANFQCRLKYNEVSKLRIAILDIENIETGVLKTDLKITLDDSLDSNILFNVFEAERKLVAEKGYIKTKNGDVLYDGKVDVDKDIIIETKGIKLGANTALKLKIVKDGKTEEIRYVASADMREVILAMEGGVSFDEISVEISVVDIVIYSKQEIANANVTLQFVDGDKHVLTDKELLEESRKVKVTIEPVNGYYVVANLKKLSEGKYVEEVKFSEYKKVMEKHPVKKYVNVVLDVTDPYAAGKVTYILNGEEITATISKELREEDSLKVKYEITESGYKFTGGVLDFITLIKTKSEDIEIASELDGTTVTVGTYIQVEKK